MDTDHDVIRGACIKLTTVLRTELRKRFDDPSMQVALTVVHHGDEVLVASTLKPEQLADLFLQFICEHGKH